MNEGEAMARMSGFVYQDRYFNQLKNLTDQELGRLVRSLNLYHMTGEAQELKGRESVAYDIIRYEIDEAERAYQGKCEINKKNRNGANGNNTKQTTTTDNDRERSSTTVDDRGQPSTTEPNRIELNRKEDICEEEEEVKNARARLIDADWKMVADAYQAQIGMLPLGKALDVLTSYVEDLHGETVVKAIEITNEKTPENPHQYLVAILKNFDKNGIDSRQKAEAYLLERERRIANESGRNWGKVRGHDQRGEADGGSGACAGNRPYTTGRGQAETSGDDNADSFDRYLESTHI